LLDWLSENNPSQTKDLQALKFVEPNPTASTNFWDIIIASVVRGLMPQMFFVPQTSTTPDQHCRMGSHSLATAVYNCRISSAASIRLFKFLNHALQLNLKTGRSLSVLETSSFGC
jgi:hypothetical protein